MLFQEKTKLAAPGDVSGLGYFFAMRLAWARIFPGNRPHSHQNAPSLGQDFGTPACSPELHGLIDTLKLIRRRILTHTFLGGSTAWSAWILIGLIVVGSVSATLGGWIVFAAIFAVIGIVGIFAWTVRTRLTIYETACRLDSAASLQDRVSTAIYLGDIKNPDGIVQRQRVDAVSRLAKVDPGGLFPVHMPAAARRALVLILVVAGLFIYRMNHKPPLVALLQTTARSSLVQSIFSPLVHAMERDLQRTMALVGLKPEPQADEVRAGEAMPTPEDLWPSGDENGLRQRRKRSRELLDASDRESQDELQGCRAIRAGLPSADSQQQEGGEETQQGKNGNDNDGNAPTPTADAQGAESDRQSLMQTLTQALKNMLSNPPKQPSNDRGDHKAQPPNAQGASQSGDAHQPGTTESDKNQQARGSSDPSEKQTQTSANGAGNQPGAKDLRKDHGGDAFEPALCRTASLLRPVASRSRPACGQRLRPVRRSSACKADRPRRRPSLTAPSRRIFLRATAFICNAILNMRTTQSRNSVSRKNHKLNPRMGL